MATFTVIIPFYQKQPGILQRALSSVFGQTFQDLEIIIVDDESPLSPDGDLELLTAEQRQRTTVIRQTNAGPGGARNTGLDHVPSSTRFVAFLDSDDIWAPEHLRNAYDTLSRFGGDCYWASIHGGEEFYYHFSMAELAKSENVTPLSEVPLVIEIPGLASVMLKDWGFLHLSCMVIARPLFGTVRFDAALRLAAEDVLFFCDCMLAASRVLLCDERGALRGEGVNIFHSIDNASPEFARQQFNTWIALDTLETRFSRRPNDVASIRSYKDTARKQVLWSQARQLKHRKLPQIGLLAEWVWRDPALLQSAVRLAVGKISG
jgi:succinoglycan biosynthesis protein ExoW